MTLKYDMGDFTHCLESHTSDYLIQEMSFTKVQCKTQLLEIHELELRKITALISVADETNVLVAFSFDWELLEQLTRVFLDSTEIEVDEEDCLDMASEFINIIVGLCTTNISHEVDHPILFSPPVLIQAAKTLRHHKHSQFFAIELETEFGKMDISCIGPREIFNH